jgi:drug/metabolite transporter (DMT)-like permease
VQEHRFLWALRDDLRRCRSGDPGQRREARLGLLFGLLLFAALALLSVAVPATVAFFAYTEGGTSLWAAAGFTALAVAGFWAYLLSDHSRNGD